MYFFAVCCRGASPLLEDFPKTNSCKIYHVWSKLRLTTMSLRRYVVEHEAVLVRLTLLLIGVTAFAVRLFAIVKFESVIHEFDPYFNLKATRVLVDEGFRAFWNWFDATSWYPLGRIGGQALYPGVMVTAAFVFRVCHTCGLPVDIRDVCVFLGPLFACLTAFASYALLRECCRWRSTALLGALLVSFSPAYLSRSVGGSFDNEAVAITALLHAFYWIIRAFQRRSLRASVAASIAYFYMASAWGGYVYITNVVALFVLVQLFLGGLDSRHMLVYLVFHCLGSILVAQLPIVGMNAFRGGEHIASHAVAIVCAGIVAYECWRPRLSRLGRATLAVLALLPGALVAFLLKSRICQMAGRTLTLIDPTYAAKFVPIIASVSEHQPSTWFNLAFDMDTSVMAGAAPGLLVCLSPTSFGRHGQGLGLFFLAMFAVTSTYFAAVMSRMTLVATPAACLVAAVGYTHVMALVIQASRPASAEALASGTVDNYSSELSLDEDVKGDEPINQPARSSFFNLVFLFFVFTLLANGVLHATWTAASVFANPSVIIEQSLSQSGARFVIDDFREAYAWLNHNTPPNAVVASWWDYGYQVSAMSRRTTLVDNNTWHNRHMATVGLALSLPEAEAHAVLRYLDVDYMVVVFGGAAAQTVRHNFLTNSVRRT